MAKPILQGAFLTVLTLFGGLAIGFLLGTTLYEALPGSTIESPLPMHITLAALPALAGFLGGGAAWGIMMGRMAGITETRRMAWAGMIGFAPVVLGVALFLAMIEPLLVKNFGPSTGIHRIFTLVFVPSAFLIAGISAWAIGRGLRNNALAVSLFWRVGLAGGVSFLLINLIMEASGWVVGAPGAGERFTMLTVMGLGNVGAAFVGGGVIGYSLTAHRG